MTYPELIAAVKKTGVPWPIVVMHLKFGTRPPETCGGCARLGVLPIGSGHRVCLRSFSEQMVDPATVACGKWRSRPA